MENDYISTPIKVHDLYNEVKLSLSERARLYAERVDTETNHLYDGKPYSVHYDMVVDVANRFMHLDTEDNSWKEIILAACRTHDVIEDCRQTYDDVNKALNSSYVADIVYALTNEKGKIRKEKANDKYYEGIRITPCATFVKLCDRIANVEYSIKTSSTKKIDMYAKENDNFHRQLYQGRYREMFNYLDELLEKHKQQN